MVAYLKYSQPLHNSNTNDSNSIRKCLLEADLNLLFIELVNRSDSKLTQVQTTDINTEDLFEKEEIIRIKVQYHVKRLRMSTRKILKNTVSEKHTSKALKE